tara:strand:+ start:405 stop:509 length:105 start_codon:yes stop_codon:yes gene_type:complete
MRSQREAVAPEAAMEMGSQALVAVAAMPETVAPR